MSDRQEPDRDTHGDEQQALEEIRVLFARYRQMGRHGMVTERDEHAEQRAQEAKDAPALAGR
jgi:hypothetical protein